MKTEVIVKPSHMSRSRTIKLTGCKPRWSRSEQRDKLSIKFKNAAIAAWEGKVREGDKLKGGITHRRGK
jgi:hypothetical protein